MKKPAGDLQSAVALPVDLGQSLGGRPNGKALGRSVYLGFEDHLL